MATKINKYGIRKIRSMINGRVSPRVSCYPSPVLVLNRFWKRLLGPSAMRFLYTSSMFVKRRPLKVLFIFGNKKNLHTAKSDEYVDGGSVAVLFLAKSSRTSSELCAVAFYGATATNCSAISPGVYVESFRANGVELLDSIFY